MERIQWNWRRGWGSTKGRDQMGWGRAQNMERAEPDGWAWFRLADGQDFGEMDKTQLGKGAKEQIAYRGALLPRAWSPRLGHSTRLSFLHLL